MSSTRKITLKWIFETLLKKVDGRFFSIFSHSDMLCDTLVFRQKMPGVPWEKFD